MKLSWVRQCKLKLHFVNIVSCSDNRIFFEYEKKYSQIRRDSRNHYTICFCILDIRYMYYLTASTYWDSLQKVSEFFNYKYS